MFWGVGIRRIMAGVPQILRPSFTASILGLKDQAADKIVAELGYAMSRSVLPAP
ncbi:hypothetical protein [Rhodopseudomonas palustris]|uniref:Uncharacterized protein n=1 Tax=Rhodopseudomonas palustris (strain ATCC BAA-98 / CGA009) TaxID=258594 RepID=Q6N2P5_RHOPA|nr:hypothetical protein [Rhodopseudomonas palustris]WAB76897.1 hypothetical protein OR798_20750 [Rhodopseudomonas palustris]WCL94189.1 hypothetical protein TX73_020745 [Rhodopseudomonas palustris CGA009]WND50809.1 hypothetical protein L1A21_20670 [Rhodopseudomonas palustris]CAE29445.1 conserved hypothetical protein [Rhodopseudomonas palustris CGA009]